jgi:hypothetical protein
VEDTTRLPDVGACSGFYLSITDPRPDGTFEDVGQLVLVVVDVGVHEDARLHGMLNDGKPATGLLTGYLELDAKSAEIDKGPTTRSHVHVVTVHRRTVLPRARAG